MISWCTFHDNIEQSIWVHHEQAKLKCGIIRIVKWSITYMHFQVYVQQWKNYHHCINGVTIWVQQFYSLILEIPISRYGIYKYAYNYKYYLLRLKLFSGLYRHDHAANLTPRCRSFKITNLAIWITQNGVSMNFLQFLQVANIWTNFGWRDWEEPVRLLNSELRNRFRQRRFRAV
jgi:hypothetical protein